MDTEDSCSLLIKQVHDAVEKRLNNSLRESGLTNVQLGTLLILSRTEGRILRMKELERILHVSQPTVAGIVERLEEKGLVRSVQCPRDRRSKQVEITAQGDEKARHEHGVLTGTNHRMFQGITKEQQEEMIRLLRIMLDNLREGEAGENHSEEC